MVDGLFDNLTVNLLSKLNGMVDVQGDIRSIGIVKGNVANFRELKVEELKVELYGDDQNSYSLDILPYYVIPSDEQESNIRIQGWRGTPTAYPKPFPIVLQPRGGNVGIGTERPSEKLTIQGDAEAPYALNVGGTSNARIKVRHLDGKDFQSGNLDNLYLQYGVKHHTILNAGGSNGNVGIGTTNPKEKLEVNGNIKVTGDIFLTNADCAEEFDVVDAESVEPGTVMVIDRDGGLRPSEQAYDKRVAGVISGAGDLRPGIILDKKNERANRLPLALTGKVYCKIDAQYGSVDIGDLLTTSPTSGHAMRTNDPIKAFGSVIGKALQPMEMGRGMIPILVALQ